MSMAGMLAGKLPSSCRSKPSYIRWRSGIIQHSSDRGHRYWRLLRAILCLYKGRFEMFSWRRVSEKAAKGILIGVTVIVGMRFYYVREMLAAFVLFSLLFACVAAALALLFAIDRASRAATEFIELHRKKALQHAHSWHSVPETRAGIQR